MRVTTLEISINSLVLSQSRYIKDIIKDFSYVMVLTEQQIYQILKVNPAKELLATARQKSNVLNMHNTGDNFKSAILIMDQFEDEQKKNLRQKYSRSNKDIFERLHRPIDKIFTAKGGSVIYDMPDEQKNELSGYLDNIRNGMSLRKWVQQIALPAYQIDPMGVIFMEITPNSDNPIPYPCYKSTKCIYDYKLNGRYLEYIVFELSEAELRQYIFNYNASNDLSLDESNADLNQVISANPTSKTTDKRSQSKYYRVVDDENDYLVELTGNTSTILQQYSLSNSFTDLKGNKKIPAIIISDILRFDSSMYLSPDDNIVDLANDFLTDCSVFNIFKKLHGFPKAWRFMSVCSTCMGTTTKDGNECPDCNGSGFNARSSVRDDIMVPPPSQDNPTFPSQFGGYIVPPIDAWSKMSEEMEKLYFMMFETLWGTVPQQAETDSAKPKTATAKFIDTQAMYDRLKAFSCWAETIETFVINQCGKLLYPSFRGVSDNYGDRYLVESPDVIWEKYEQARTSGAPQATLDSHLRDYYESKFEGSPIDLAKALKLMKVEPFIHYTVKEVGFMLITKLDKLSKYYFDEWISLKDDMDIISTDAEELQKELQDWTSVKLAQVEIEEEAARAAAQATDDLDAPINRTEAEKAL